jgi:acetyltransferase-like isoleucine patch superfamily enzyme
MALARLAIRGNVTIGVYPRIGRGARIASVHGLQIGHFVAVGPKSVVEVGGEIGDFAVFATGVLVVGRDDHRIDAVGTPVYLTEWIGDRPERDRDRVNVGRDVWIGAGAIVLSGVTIGEGAIVGAGTVVARDVAPYAIVAGNPARVVGMRFGSESERRRHSDILEERVKLLDAKYRRSSAGDRQRRA